MSLECLTDGVKNELHSIAQSIATTYDLMYEGDYNLLVDDNKGKSYMAKGDHIISEDSSYIDGLAQKSDMDISVFFYDMRMLTTLLDEEGNRYLDTVAHAAVKEAVLVGEKETFYNRLTIGADDYFVDYMPLFSQSGTCIGMIATAKKSNQVEADIMNMIIKFALLTIIIMVVAALIVLRYINEISASIGRIMKFLGEIAQGRLNTNIDERVFARTDELGEMARFTVSVQGDLKKLIEKDALTGLYNRRSLKNKLEDMQKNANSFCVALGDIDFFKKVNDNYGHAVGDEVLKNVAEIIKQSLRESDIPSRYGGEEFAILLPYTKLEEAGSVAQRLRGNVEAKHVDLTHVKDAKISEIQVTVSVGVYEYKEGDEPQQLYTKADKALYYAKEHGRNQVGVV